MSASAATQTEEAKAELPLTDDQKTARLEIAKANKRKGRHLLEGGAGVGKTYLMTRVIADMLERKKAVVATAPTHAAVAVLAAKLSEAGLDVPVRTIQSFLSLEPRPDEHGIVRLKRNKWAKPVEADCVAIDETSMNGTELCEHIDRHLFHAFVLYIGDDHQIPPVGEGRSPTFNTRSRSVLRETVRQEADNPVLKVALEVRALQESPDMDWSWIRSEKNGSRGVFRPGGSLDLWLQKAYSSSDFAGDSKAFRYLCWTNARVANINAKVRNWLFGETDFPFVPGETALIRQPIMDGDTVLFTTNEEAKVDAIEAGVFKHRFQKRNNLEAWAVEIPSWKVTLIKAGGESKYDVWMPRDESLVSDINDRLASEGRVNWERYQDREAFKTKVGRLQAIYAQTVHTAQGSTHGHTFVDVPDIRRRERDNLLEMKQLLYTALSRPRYATFLCGV